MIVKYQEKLTIIKSSVLEIMMRLVESNQIILEALEDCNNEKFENAMLLLKNGSKKTEEIDKIIVITIALFAPEGKDLRELVSFLKITNELLRASSSTRSFVKGFQEVCNKVNMLAINEYAIPMQSSTVECLEYTLKILTSENIDEIESYLTHVLIAESKTDDLYEMLESNIFKKPTKENEFINYHNMLSALRKSEKVADRGVSIATLILYAKSGKQIQQL